MDSKEINKDEISSAEETAEEIESSELNNEELKDTGSDSTSVKTVKTVSNIMVITLIGKIFGLLRDQFFAWNYATGKEASAFFSASRIPRVFFDAVFASAITSCFRPVFNE